MKLGLGGALAIGGAAVKGVDSYLKKRKANKESGSNSSGSGVYQTLTGGSADPPSYKRGGKVKKGGRAKVHKNERVLTAKQDKKYMKMKRAKRGSKR